VFIDKHHSDEILETPGEDVNDIKLLTVQTCRKMGGRYTKNFGFHIPDLSCVYIEYLFSASNGFLLFTFSSIVKDSWQKN
jgi:hypothetical protein